jgi:hypothetical protein
MLHIMESGRFKTDLGGGGFTGDGIKVRLDVSFDNV